MTQIDWTKPVETVTGIPVKVLRNNGNGKMEVQIQGGFSSRSYLINGKHYLGEQPDIRNVLVDVFSMTDQELADKYRKAREDYRDFLIELDQRGFKVFNVNGYELPSAIVAVNHGEVTIKKTVTTDIFL